MEASYRRGPGPLPLQGARIHVLQAAGSGPMLGSMAIWMGTLFIVVPLSMLAEGRVPDEALPFISIPLVVLGLLGAVFYYRRALQGGTWRMHHEGSRMLFERASPSWVLDLDDARLEAGRYEYRVKATRAALPTVTISAPGLAPLIVTGPLGFGWENLGERDILASMGEASASDAVPTSGAPQLRLDDPEAFTALQSKAQRA